MPPSYLLHVRRCTTRPVVACEVARPPRDRCDQGHGETRHRLVATMTALVLGLVTASAKNSFDSVDYRGQAHGDRHPHARSAPGAIRPESREIRAAMKTAVGRKIEQLWPQDGLETGGSRSRGRRRRRSKSWSTACAALNADRRRPAATAGASRDISESLLATRWLAAADQSTSIPFVFLVVRSG